MTEFSEKDLTCDGFLSGRLNLFQPRDGYRAGVDPVLLAASVPASAGDSILELGCGAGAASLCLAVRVPGVRVTGVELQPAYADLARMNAQRNQIEFTVVQADLAELPEPLCQVGFDHVIANPPYFRAGAHSKSRDAGRSIALGEHHTPLADWIAVAARRLAPKGYLHIIQRVERLPEMLSACQGRLGSLEVLPLAARAGRAPDLVILRARKGGRASFRLLSPLIMHMGERHLQDGDSYCPEISGVLRDGKALEWPVL